MLYKYIFFILFINIYNRRSNFFLQKKKAIIKKALLYIIKIKNKLFPN